MPQVQHTSLKVETDKIRENIIQGGIARQAITHAQNLKGSSETFDWLVRNDKTFLRYSMNFDKTRYRSKFGTQKVTLATPGIEDGLAYSHYELEGVNSDILPQDERQRLLAAYFAEAEDRIAFAGVDPGVGTAKNMPITTSTTKATNDAAAPGTYASITAIAEWDLTTNITARATLLGLIGQIRDHFGPSLKQYALKIVCTGDVQTRLEGYVDANGVAQKQLIIDALNEAGANGGGEILASDYLGATIDYDLGELEVTAGTTNAVLIWMWEGNAVVETSPLIQRSDINDIDGLRVNIEEKYVPIWKNAHGQIYSGTVDISS